MDWLLTPLAILATLGFLLVVAMALLAPFEALGWWAGWSERQLAPLSLGAASFAPTAAADFYLVYLTAIGGISAEEISSRERRFLQRLSAALPGEVVIVDDVFPFSASNNPLNGERPLSWLWQRIHNSRLSGRGSIFTALIFIRNLFQVAVSGDPRYGPMYNAGVAREVLRSLIRHGYPPGSDKPIAVMGWSGGGQIAVGIVPYLHQALEAPIDVVSVGGVIANDPGIAHVRHLYHLQGSADSFPHISDILYPGRWPIVSYSPWNQARREGKIITVDPGPMKHTGKEDYFDRHATLPDGKTYLDRTVEVIAGLLSDAAATAGN